MSNIDSRIEIIEERNRRVEIDKAWEKSATRRAFIAGITYICACLFLWMIGAENAPVAALVPVIGYYLSTLSLPFAKSWWITNIPVREK
jgi:preprotein translocase subunit SecF